MRDELALSHRERGFVAQQAVDSVLERVSFRMDRGPLVARRALRADASCASPGGGSPCGGESP